ncbi:MAG: carbon-nitrogen hydrolase family protein [Campylobacterales bacterium]
MSRTLRIAAIQSASLPYDRAKLDYFLTLAKGKEAQVVVLGEYLLNLFFRELLTTPLSMIAEQSQRQVENLTQLARIYKVPIIAPLVTIKNGNPLKGLYLFEEEKSRFWSQQILMPYHHWNEAAFFANKPTALKTPPVVNIGGIKIGLLMGFETHFPQLWEKLSQKKVDVVITPTAATFESQKRWRELLHTMAFLHHCYVLRVNRIGEYGEGSFSWRFYGDSFLVDPFGLTVDALGEEEAMMVVDIERDQVVEARETWQFSSIAHARR